MKWCPDSEGGVNRNYHITLGLMLGCPLLVVGVLLSDLASGEQKVLNSYEAEHGVLRRFANKTAVSQILALAEVSPQLGNTSRG